MSTVYATRTPRRRANPLLYVAHEGMGGTFEIILFRVAFPYDALIASSCVLHCGMQQWVIDHWMV